MHDSVNAHTHTHAHAKLCSMCCVYAQIIMLKIYAKKKHITMSNICHYTKQIQINIFIIIHMLYTHVYGCWRTLPSLRGESVC